MPFKVLIVDDNADILASLSAILLANNFEVVTANTAKAALALIASDDAFDILLCDLHLPGNAGGITVVSAMRHTHPETITIVFSGYPDLQQAMSVILLQADEILVKPFNVPALLELIENRLLNMKLRVRPRSERVASILARETRETIDDWFSRVQRCDDLLQVSLSFQERTAYLPQLFQGLVDRLRNPRVLEEIAPHNEAAHAHGRTRFQQGYTAPMMVEESRMLQVSIFQTLQNNLSTVDFSLLLGDVMAIADEVDAQLKQQLMSYSASMTAAASA